MVKRKVRDFLSDDLSGKRGLHVGPFFPQPLISIHGYQHYNAEIGLVPHMERSLPRDERGKRFVSLADFEKTARMPA